MQRARAIGGVWERASKTWQFDESAEETVRAALRDVYGSDGADETCTLYLMPISNIESLREAVTAGPITIARAFGRDSGARMGNRVAHLSGSEPSSGGSRANWVTFVPAGALFAVYNVPRGLAEQALADEAWIGQIGDGTENASEIAATLTRQATAAQLDAAERDLRERIAWRHTAPKLPRFHPADSVRQAVGEVRRLRGVLAGL